MYWQQQERSDTVVGFGFEQAEELQEHFIVFKNPASIFFAFEE